LSIGDRIGRSWTQCIRGCIDGSVCRNCSRSRIGRRISAGGRLSGRIGNCVCRSIGCGIRRRMSRGRCWSIGDCIRHGVSWRIRHCIGSRMCRGGCRGICNCVRLGIGCCAGGCVSRRESRRIRNCIRWRISGSMGNCIRWCISGCVGRSRGSIGARVCENSGLNHQRKHLMRIWIIRAGRETF